MAIHRQQRQPDKPAKPVADLVPRDKAQRMRERLLQCVHAVASAQLMLPGLEEQSNLTQDRMRKKSFATNFLQTQIPAGFYAPSSCNCRSFALKEHPHLGEHIFPTYQIRNIYYLLYMENTLLYNVKVSKAYPKYNFNTLLEYLI